MLVFRPTGLSHFPFTEAATLLVWFIYHNKCHLAITLHLKTMCAASCFISFWNTICSTSFVFLLRILHRILRSCVLASPDPLSLILHVNIWLRSHIHVFSLNLILKCFAVSSGRRHRYLIQTSVTHLYYFSHHLRIYFHLWDESHRFCFCLIVLICIRRGSIRGIPLSLMLPPAILEGFKHPKTTLF